MDKNIPKTYSILAVLLLVALAIAGYVVFNTFWPNYQLAIEAKVVAEDNNATLKKALADIETFVADDEAQAVNTGRVQLALPAGDPDMPNFISSMAQVAASSGVSLSNFQISAGDLEEVAAPYSIQATDFRMSASGSFASFKDFLRRVESHLRLVDIYHVGVRAGSVSSAADAESILQFDVKMHTYFQE